MDQDINFLDVLRNIVDTLPSIYMLASSLFLATGFWLTVSASMDLYQLTDRNRKYLGSKQPTGRGVVFKYIVAGLTGAFASTGQLGSIIASIFFKNHDVKLMALESYMPQAGEDELQILIKVLVTGFTQVCGLIAIYKGLIIWSKAADGSGNIPASKGSWHIVCGVLCLKVTTVLAVIQGTIGFKIFAMFGI